MLASPTMTVIGLLPAIATSYGPTSPDADNTPTAKRIDAAIPDEILGGCGPLHHRALLHWWGLPALAYLIVDPVPGWPRLILMAAIIGWTSHILADFVFGKAGFGTRRGIPILPWGWHVGLGLKVGGPAEKATVQVLRAAAGIMLLIAVGWDQVILDWIAEFTAPFVS